MSTVVTFENLWRVFEHRSGQLVHALEDVNSRVDPGELAPEAMGIFKFILEHMGITE